MEAQLIEAVLSGRLSVQAALAWALGDGEEPPPIELRLGSPWRAGSGPRPALRPADFRVRRRQCRHSRLLACLACLSQPAPTVPLPPLCRIRWRHSTMCGSRQSLCLPLRSRRRPAPPAAASPQRPHQRRRRPAGQQLRQMRARGAPLPRCCGVVAAVHSRQYNSRHSSGGPAGHLLASGHSSSSSNRHPGSQVGSMMTISPRLQLQLHLAGAGGRAQAGAAPPSPRHPPASRQRGSRCVAIALGLLLHCAAVALWACCIVWPCLGCPSAPARQLHVATSAKCCFACWLTWIAYMEHSCVAPLACRLGGGAQSCLPRWTASK